MLPVLPIFPSFRLHLGSGGVVLEQLYGRSIGASSTMA